jgi:hypothetical protein
LLTRATSATCPRGTAGSCARAAGSCARTTSSTVRGTRSAGSSPRTLGSAGRSVRATAATRACSPVGSRLRAPARAGADEESTSEERDNDSGVAHQRAACSNRLVRRPNDSAGAPPMLMSPNRSERVEPISAPPAKYVPESESGRMSYVNGWS